ncbi:MAG: UbiA family prenyltransferase [archaeon]
MKAKSKKAASTNKANKKINSKEMNSKIKFQKRVKLSALVELMRPANCIMAAIAILIGFFIVGGIDYFAAVIAALSGFLVCAGGQTINDYFDRKIDVITSAHRPIPSGRVSARKALWFALILFIIGIGFASLINVTSQFIAILMTILLIAYPLFMNKVKYVGNVIVALGTAITFIYGAASAGNILPLIIALSITAFFSNMAREVTKDIEDVKKDTKAKHTLPIILGVAKAKAFPILYYVLAIFLSVWIYFYFNLNPAYLFVALIGAVFFAYSSSALIRNNPKKSQKLSKYGMLISLVAFIVAGIN